MGKHKGDRLSRFPRLSLLSYTDQKEMYTENINKGFIGPSYSLFMREKDREVFLPASTIKQTYKSGKDEIGELFYLMPGFNFLSLDFQHFHCEIKLR